MSSLPQEVLETILIGLPAFDVVRCKAVCKFWRYVISSADFVAAHLERAKSDPSSHHLLVRNSRLFHFPRRQVPGPSSSFACFSSSDLLIVGSANGLICIAGKGEHIPSPDDIWILNPVTGLSKKLPYSGVPFGTDQNIKFAFWCDEAGAYNVAKFLSNPNAVTTLQLWVSSSPYTWTDVSTFELDFHFHHRRYHACDVLIEGLAAYWILVGEYYEEDCDSDDYYRQYPADDEITVVSLDLKTLTMIKFMPFSKGQLRMWNCDLCRARSGDPNAVLFGGNLNGEFVLVAVRTPARERVYSTPARERVYSIYTLRTRRKGRKVRACWVRKFTFRLGSFPFEKCLGIVNDKLVLTSRGDKEVALYDPMSGTLEVIERGSKLETTTLDSACGFVGSLVSMDGFGFEWNDLLRKYMGIKWPYSLYPSVRKEDGWRMNSCRKRRRVWDLR